MAIGYGVAVPKGKTVKQQRAKAKREDAKKLKAWRDTVWDRETYMTAGDTQIAYCEDCRATVSRGPDGFSADVHHIISRRHRASRYDPANGILLCRTCHNRTHGREF